ncbi:divalent-cation tolerance protein CutA [Streptomyces sp. NPDC004311]|uniref:divalent-cation tolerance protein CutA n=1 Tax=Streptomyces sp. NPDC004311 TaxID=3364698 RepID=UPI0036C68826
MATEIVIAQTTIDDEGKAEALARGAVEARLAACAHVDAAFTAVYRWKGKIETAKEWRISYKTTTDRLPALAAWVAATHSYEVPEWIILPVIGGSETYLKWVVDESAAQ